MVKLRKANQRRKPKRKKTKKVKMRVTKVLVIKMIFIVNDIFLTILYFLGHSEPALRSLTSSDLQVSVSN